MSSRVNYTEIRYTVGLFLDTSRPAELLLNELSPFLKVGNGKEIESGRISSDYDDASDEGVSHCKPNKKPLRDATLDQTDSEEYEKKVR